MLAEKETLREPTATPLSANTVIGSDRVEGTAVYGVAKKKIGSVDRLLIDKREGKVTDVILSVGGFLGIGDEKHSVPWEKLDYDTDLSGYLLDVSEDELRNAPRFKANEPDRVYDRDYQRSVYEYWMVAPMW